MTATVDAPALQKSARDALVALIERHGLPVPPRTYWSELAANLRIAFDSDADVDAWAKALFKTPTARFNGWDNEFQRDAWTVTRSYGFTVPTWMGVGVSLDVAHNEARACRPERAS